VCVCGGVCGCAGVCVRACPYHRITPILHFVLNGWVNDHQIFMVGSG
jgi:hypothetical protein